MTFSVSEVTVHVTAFLTVPSDHWPSPSVSGPSSGNRERRSLPLSSPDGPSWWHGGCTRVPGGSERLWALVLGRAKSTRAVPIRCAQAHWRAGITCSGPPQVGRHCWGRVRLVCLDRAPGSAL